MRSIIIAAAACYASSGAPAQDIILLKPNAEGVTVEYQFDAPTVGFRFHTPPQPEARISADDISVSVSSGGVSTAVARDRFSIDLAPDRLRTDATYPVLTRLGAGWMIYLPALLGRPPADVRSGDLNVTEGWTLRAGPGARPFDGFIYLSEGPGDDEAVISAPSIPAWLVDDVRSAAGRSNDAFSTRLSLASPVEPTVLISPLPPEDRSVYVGDVTPNGVINLQFAASALPSERDQRFTDMVQPFVAHEVFHNWQGGRFQAQEGVNGRWLDEGAAEYFSLVAQASSSPDVALRSRNILSGRLAACLSKLEDEKTGLLNLNGPSAERTRYDCGAVAHWLVDIENGPSKGAWGVWRGILTARGDYSVRDFIAAANADSSIALTALFHGGDDVRTTILHALKDHAEEADSPPTGWATAAAWPLLESNCKGQMGIMTSDDGRWILDTGDRCGPISGDPELLGIGDDLFTDAGARAYKAVEAACTVGGEITVAVQVSGERRQVSVPCTRPASPPPVNYRVLQLL